jgi:hypothetical protein
MDPYDYAASLLSMEVRTRGAEFWQAFAREPDRLDAGFSGQSPGAIDQSVQVMGGLAKVSPDLMWGFCPPDRGHALCITAEWRDTLRPLARLVRQMAPDLPRWRFPDARKPSKWDEGLDQNIEARFREPVGLSRIEATLGREGRIDLVGHGRGTEKALADQSLAMATYLLVEAVARDWIGAIDGVPERSGFFGLLGKRGAAFVPGNFRDTVRETIARARAAMPERPYAEAPYDTRQTVVDQLSGLPEAHRGADLFTLDTSNEAHAQGMLSMGRFASPCFSRNGEWFVYLRISRTPELPFDDVDDRYTLEARLHAALAEGGIGGWVAGGRGREAVYIDLAATQVGQAVGRIGEVMASEPAGVKATVHFLDTGLEELVLPAVTEKVSVH